MFGCERAVLFNDDGEVETVCGEPAEVIVHFARPGACWSEWYCFHDAEFILVEAEERKERDALDGLTITWTVLDLRADA